MDLKCKKIGRWVEVTIKEDGTSICLGMLDEAELKALAKQLEEAVDELLSY